MLALIRQALIMHVNVHKVPELHALPMCSTEASS